jgi:hypothetical protein
MPAGSSPAGTGVAGHDPVPPDPLRSSPRAGALYFELFERVFPFADEGDAILTHPVDQAVALAVGIHLGSVAAAPNLGVDFQRLKRTSAAAMQSAVTDVVRTALRALIDAGDIAFLGAPLMPEARGRPWFFVDYTNLRIPASNAGPRRIAIR